MYDGWTDHTVIVTPSLRSGFDIRITGRDRNQTKEYLYEVFDSALREVIDFDHETKKYFVPSWREAAAEYDKALGILRANLGLAVNANQTSTDSRENKKQTKPLT